VPGCHTARPGPRYELPEDGMDQDHEARHDRLCLRLSGSSARSWRSDAQPSPRPEPEPDTWPSTVQDHRRGVTSPARWTTAATRSSRSTGTGPSIIYGTDGPSTQSGGTSKSSMWTLKSSRSGPPSPPRTWPRRPAST
ncbi:Hypothetical protein GSB_152381, partial [Giardia duodenalis]